MDSLRTDARKRTEKQKQKLETYVVPLEVSPNISYAAPASQLRDDYLGAVTFKQSGSN